MAGNLLYLTGMVDIRTMEKYAAEAKELGRESWYLSWALDSSAQERNKGKTVEVGRAYFETESRRYTILDAPGHKNFVPSMINGAAQADVAILVISARKGEFETGFEKGGQTREHILLVKTAGVSKVIVVINKMDDPTVSWNKDRYDEIVGKLAPFLKSAGFEESEFIPVSAFTGANLKDKVDIKKCPWWPGPSLLQYLDSLPAMIRSVNAPLMMPIFGIYNDMGTIVIGKIESGTIQKGDLLVTMPNRCTVEVSAIYSESRQELPAAQCGDNVHIRLHIGDVGIIRPGFILCGQDRPANVVTTFRAQLAILDSNSLICPGYKAVMHIHTSTKDVTLMSLISYYCKKTGRRSKKPPPFAKKGQKVLALLETSKPVCVERFADFPQLGRFILRDEGRTVAIGKVVEIMTGQNSGIDLAPM